MGISFMHGNASGDPERQAWLFLNHVPYLGPMRFHKLMRATKSAQDILRMSALELTQADIGLELAAHWRATFADAARWAAVEKEEALAARGHFQILTELDEAYPDNLRDVVDRPPVLYIKGVWPPPAIKMIALVGTRHATPYGVQIAEQFTRDLVAQGFSTVSGLAAGIDTVVHETTLDRKGYTIAVLGHGLEHQFPRANARLFEEISHKGALVTEFSLSYASTGPALSTAQPNYFRVVLGGGGGRSRGKVRRIDHRTLCGGARSRRLCRAGTHFSGNKSRLPSFNKGRRRSGYVCRRFFR